MSTITTTFGSLLNDPFFIGWDKVIKKANQVSEYSSISGSYPPYNVKKIDDDNFVIELALAGWTKEELTITEENGVITISGDKLESEDNYLHKGIATRKFTRAFSLAEYIKISNASMENGILSLELFREIPEEKKPRIVEISGGKKAINK